MKKSNVFIISLFLSLVLTPLVLAQWGSWGGFGYGYNSPLYYLENEWVMFSLVFLVFFAVIFFTVNKSFKNPPVAGVVALSLSLFIGITIAQRGLINRFGGGETIGAWALVVACLIAFGFLLKFSYESFGRIGIVAAVLIIWALLHGSDPYDILPSELINNNAIIFIYEFLAGWIGLIFLIIISAIIISARIRRGQHTAGRLSESFFGG